MNSYRNYSTYAARRYNRSHLIALAGARDGSPAGLRRRELIEEAQQHGRALAERTARLTVVVGHSNGALLAVALAGMGEATAVGHVAPAQPPSAAG
ncbi:hypothetical protein SAMN05444004_12520 [Jannaschia faecimaris]|uniref:Alpha/beta hydrolase family protein n=1 Tax=Jannaschia faecimaris TaxID=1244108 RepID=A0A1H3U979_9RHOB|nr:hypothetical protein [Jannaschia faecimaris]SDZ58355.1 hypothetical protein SAMN05444004_12520 [Jannaschia faecimaris]